jgi:hypothetical protein
VEQTWSVQTTPVVVSSESGTGCHTLCSVTSRGREVAQAVATFHAAGVRRHGRCCASWVEKLPSGRYRARYRAEDGRQHSKSFPTKRCGEGVPADRRRRHATWAMGRPARRSDVVPGLGRRLGCRPGRAADDAQRRRGTDSQPPAAGVRPPAAEGHHADGSPVVHRAAGGATGAGDGAALPRAAVADARRLETARRLAS